MSALDGRGLHLIADLRNCRKHLKLEQADDLLREAAAAGGARVVGVHTHEFAGGGVAAIALLAESHISLHTWPELGYVAVDVFMCGSGAVPERALEVITRAVAPGAIALQTLTREATESAAVCGSGGESRPSQ